MTMSSTTSSSRYYVPAFAGIYAALDRFMLPLLRITLGAILIPHGCQKLFGWFSGPGLGRIIASFDQIGYRPGWLWATLVALTELVGGLMLVFGFFTRIAAVAVVIFMINAVHFTSAKGFFWTQGGSEFALLLLVVALVFAIKGGGDYSIDKSMSKEL
jgi:putative oxidoreductase